MSYFSKIFPLLAFIAISACQTREPQASVASSIAMVPRKDIRDLRQQLPGKSIKEVVQIIGQPKEVFTIDGRESWRYENIARDSVTGRPVKYVEIQFVKRHVESVNFGY